MINPRVMFKTTKFLLLFVLFLSVSSNFFSFEFQYDNNDYFLIIDIGFSLILLMISSVFTSIFMEKFYPYYIASSKTTSSFIKGASMYCIVPIIIAGIVATGLYQPFYAYFFTIYKLIALTLLFNILYGLYFVNNVKTSIVLSIFVIILYLLMIINMPFIMGTYQFEFSNFLMYPSSMGFLKTTIFFIVIYTIELVVLLKILSNKKRDFK